MINRRHCTIAIITILLALGLLVAVGLVGCGGGDGGPAEDGCETCPSADVGVMPSQGPYLGDMDSDGSPTGTDAQLILDIAADPDSYEIGDKYIADCNGNTVVETGDALKVLRAAAGEIEWPFSGGGPPPPPPI